MNNKGKNVIIVILCVVVLCLCGYLVYDKVLSGNQNDVKEEVVDLGYAKKLVDKYYEESLGSNVIEAGLTEEAKIFLAIRNTSIEHMSSPISCDSIYQNSEKATFQGYGYMVKLDSHDNKAGFCNNDTNIIHYDEVNKSYKELFGSDEEVPKRSIFFLYHVYDFNDNYFVKLSCNCGGADTTLRLYDVKSANIIDGKLVVSVGYEALLNDWEKNQYYSKIQDKYFTLDNSIEGIESFKEEYLKENLDKMDTYEFVFEQDNYNYVLKSITKK